MKNAKEPRKLKELEQFNHQIGERAIKVAFKLDGEVGKGLTEVSIGIKHLDDEEDDAFGTGLILDRISQKNDPMHYGVLTDSDILDWAAKGMAYEVVERILEREIEEEQEEEAKEMMGNIFSELADLDAFNMNMPVMTIKGMLNMFYPGFPFNEDCEDCEHIQMCLEQFKND